MRKGFVTLNKLILLFVLMNFVESGIVMPMTKPGQKILIFHFKKSYNYFYKMEK